MRVSVFAATIQRVFFLNFSSRLDLKVGAIEVGEIVKTLHISVWNSSKLLLAHHGVRANVLRALSILQISELPGIKILESLHQFLAGIHHKGAVSSNRLVDGFTTEHQHH